MSIVTARVYDDTQHPHVSSGPQGGQFTTTSTTKQAVKPKAKPAQAKPKPTPTPLPAGMMTRGGANDPRAVKALQRLIKSLGLGDLAVDGVYGPATQAAVKVVQAKLGMKQTGMASPALVQRLKIAKALSPCVGGAVKAAAEPVDVEDRDDDEMDLPDDDEDLEESEEDGGEVVTAAAGHDVTPGHDELHHYWTKGEGLAKWAESPTPWTTLVRLLSKHVPLAKAKVFASKWHKEVFGIWVGEKKGKNPLGPG